MRVCVRCGKDLTKYQRKYCCECGNEARKELARELARKNRKLGTTDTRKNHKKKPLSETEFGAWEADICLNCKRVRCDNCLEYKRNSEKEKMLKESGGKKWRD